jgi:hypothetical protein
MFKVLEYSSVLSVKLLREPLLKEIQRLKTQRHKEHRVLRTSPFLSVSFVSLCFKKISSGVFERLRSITDFMAGNDAQPWWAYTAKRIADAKRAND